MTDPAIASLPLRYDRLPATHFLHRAEMRILTPAPGSGVDAVFELAVTDETTNGFGGLQGGMTATLIDCVAAAAIRARAGGEGHHPTQEMSVQYLASLRHGPARALARVRKLGSRAVVVQVDVVDAGDDDRLCALGTVTFAVIEDRTEG
jgi:uncharacterized protein (TIGR00369 family)